ncbi:MAG: hypothetical protein JNJ45_09725 [Chthonomonas sp.]|nr:hypothetical protein [Chthonomonas sp.]
MKDVQSLPKSVEALFQDADAKVAQYREGGNAPREILAEIRLAQSEAARTIAQQQPEVAAAVFAMQAGERGIEACEEHKEEYLVEREIVFLGIKLGKRIVPETRTKTITRTYKAL